MAAESPIAAPLARLYLLTGRLLGAPPDQAMLDLVASLPGEDHPASLRRLALAAQRATPESVAAEYHRLFIGVGRGELVPYASYYLKGFLHERPLARLRSDMEKLGIARADGVSEPEDHIAALCEMMGGVIDGAFAAEEADIDAPAFFRTHLAPWASRFFADLREADAADFYSAVAGLGEWIVHAHAGALARTAGAEAPEA